MLTIDCTYIFRSGDENDDAFEWQQSKTLDFPVVKEEFSATSGSSSPAKKVLCSLAFVGQSTSELNKYASVLRNEILAIDKGNNSGFSTDTESIEFTEYYNSQSGHETSNSETLTEFTCISGHNGSKPTSQEKDKLDGHLGVFSSSDNDHQTYPPDLVVDLGECVDQGPIVDQRSSGEIPPWSETRRSFVDGSYCPRMGPRTPRSLDNTAVDGSTSPGSSLYIHTPVECPTLYPVRQPVLQPDEFEFNPRDIYDRLDLDCDTDNNNDSCNNMPRIFDQIEPAIGTAPIADTNDDEGYEWITLSEQGSTSKRTKVDKTSKEEKSEKGRTRECISVRNDRKVRNSLSHSLAIL